jgi:hypothetical protein
MRLDFLILLLAAGAWVRVVTLRMLKDRLPSPPLSLKEHYASVFQVSRVGGVVLVLSVVFQMVVLILIVLSLLSLM